MERKKTEKEIELEVANAKFNLDYLLK